MSNKNIVVENSSLWKRISDYNNYIVEKIDDEVIGVDETLHPEDFMAVCLAAFYNRRTVKPIRAHDNVKGFVFREVISENDGNSQISVNDIKSFVGDVLMCDDVNDYKIDRQLLLNWIDFHSSVIKLDYDNTLFYVNDDTLSSFTWLLPVIFGVRIEFYQNEIISKSNSLYILPLGIFRCAGERFEGKNNTIITYGNDRFDFEHIKHKVNATQSKWFNYFGFPWVTWLSSCNNMEFNNRSDIYHSIKPIKNISLTIKDDEGRAVPNNREGRIYSQLTDQSPLSTVYKGVVLSNDKLIVTGCCNGIFYKDGSYLNESLISVAAEGYSKFTDYHIIDNTVYYCSKEILSYDEVNSYFSSRLRVSYLPLNYVEIPFIQHHFEHSEDICSYVPGSELISVFENESLKLGIDSAVRVFYENRGDTLKLVEKKSGEEPSNDISKDNTATTSNLPSVINGGAINGSKFHQLCDLLKARIDSNQKIIYFTDKGQIVQTYGELYHNAAKLAKGLKKIGINERSNVIFQIDSRKEYIECFWACMLIGATPAPLNLIDDFGTRDSNTDKLYNIWNLLEKPYVLTLDKILPQFDSLKKIDMFAEMEFLSIDKLYCESHIEQAYQWKEDETCLILFTSGSTGIPKGVQLTSKNILSRTVGEIQKYNMGSDNVDVNWMTLTHAAGLIWSHIRDVYMDILQLQIDTDIILNNPLKLLDLISKYNGSITWAPNFAYALIGEAVDRNTDYGWDLSSLRYAFAGGEANISKSLRGFLINLSKYGLKENTVIPAFGMTETSSCITYYDDFSVSNSKNNDKFVPVGSPMPGVEIRIVNNEGEIVNEGNIGAVQGKGLTFTKGYYKNESANRESFTPDGYLITGDLGYIDDGHLILTGRISEVIIVNGLNYYVQDIEAIVDEISDVTFSTALSIPNTEGVDQIIILFTPKEETWFDQDNIDQLKGIVNEIRNAIRTKCKITPHYVIPVRTNEIARTELGKKQRSLYKQEFLEGKYNDILSLISEKEDDEYYLLKEVWRKTAKDKYKHIHDNQYFRIINGKESGKNIIGNLSKDNYDLIDIASLSSVSEAIKLIDLYAYENSNTELSNFAEGLLQHGKQWATLPAGSVIYLPTCYGVSVEGDKKINLTNTLIRGFVKSISLENPNIIIKQIDVDEESTCYFEYELCFTLKEREVAYRRRQRYISTLTSINAQENTQGLMLNNKVALITGGLGGIGTILSEWLIRRHNMQLVLLGTSALTLEKKEIISRLNEIGGHKIIYRNLDISESGCFINEMRKIEEEIERPVDTIFHLAGKVSDSENGLSHWNDIESHMISNESEYSLKQTFISKVNTLLALNEFRRPNNNIPLIVFGSLNGYFGGASLSSYSAVNSLVHCYGAYYSRSDRYIYTVDWSQWENIGVMKDLPAAFRNASSSSGYISMAAEKNLKYLEYILENGIQNSMVGVDREAKRFNGLLVDKVQPIVDIFYEGKNAAAVKVLGNKLLKTKHTVLRFHEINEIPRNNNSMKSIDWKKIYMAITNDDSKENEDLTEIQKRVSAVWKEVLNLQHLNIDTDFFDCGGDSISISRLAFRLQKEFDKPITFQEILEHSTVRECAELIEERQIENSFEQVKAEVMKELYFDDFELESHQCSYGKPKEVLLTGASGFLGAHMLAKLLQDKNLKINLLIRAVNSEDAEKRVVKNMEQYGLAELIDNKRIAYYAGDISNNSLGLSKNEYDKLASNVDTIYHVASVVNFAVNFHKLYKPNVEGVRRIIAFGHYNRVKIIHYVSSFTVYSAMIQENHIINENTPLLFETSVVNEYNKTKWIADNLVQMAREKGIPAKIYRIGTLSGGTNKGICQTRDFMWLMIRVILKLKKAPILPTFGYNPIPVDIMASNIVDLSKLPYKKSEATYNIIYKTVTMKILVDWLKLIDSKIVSVNYADWRKELISYAKEKNDTALISILAVVPVADIIEGRAEQLVNSDLTNRILTENHIEGTGENFESFLKTFNYLKSVGFFE